MVSPDRPRSPLPARAAPGPERIEIRLPSRASHLGAVRSVVRGFVEEFLRGRLTEEEIAGIQLSLQEACINVVRHAHRGDASKPLVVGLVVEPDRLLLEVEDFGPGLPPEDRRPPPPDPDDPREGGYGLFIMGETMDEVRSERRGEKHVLVLAKRLRPAPDSGARPAEPATAGAPVDALPEEPPPEPAPCGAAEAAPPAARAGIDLGRLAAEPALAGVLEGLASLHRTRLAVLSPEGTVVAAFGWPGGKGPPASVPARERGRVPCRAVEVYDGSCGWVAAPAGGRAGPEEAVARAAGLLSAVATREYETASLSESLLDVFEEVNLFYGITARLHQVGSREGICATILDRACEIVRADRASILLADPRSGILRIAASRGMSPEQAASIRVRPGEGITGRVMESGQAVLVDDAGTLDRGGRSADDRYASRSFLSVPIRVFDPMEDPAEARRHRPLGVLNMTDKSDAGTFSSGDLKLLSALASQAAVLLDNTRLAGIEREMGLARRIQASLLPEGPPRVEGAELAGVCLPARNVGGDYYDMMALPDGRVAVLVADVSGHNVGAALMMAVSRAALRAELWRAEEPEEVLSRVNRLLEQDLARSELFVSVFLAMFDPRTGRLAYASAGHNPPLLLRAGSGEPELLDAEGILLGVMGDFPFERRETSLRPADLLLLYTDGLTEARDGREEMFGEARLGAALADLRDRPAEEVLRGLLARLEEFSADAGADDRTAVVLRACKMPADG